MIHWGLVIGLTIFTLMLVGVSEIANAIWNINHKGKDDD